MFNLYPPCNQQFAPENRWLKIIFPFGAGLIMATISAPKMTRFGAQEPNRQMRRYEAQNEILEVTRCWVSKA